jgi:hypothetical protein
MTTTLEDLTPKTMTGTILTPEYDDLTVELTPLEAKLRDLALVSVAAVGLAGVFGGVSGGGQQMYIYGPAGYFYHQPSTSGLIESPAILESLEALQCELNRLRKFKDDWDEDGAEVFSSDTITSAQGVLTHISNAILSLDFVSGGPMISPGTDGRISFTWRVGTKELWIYVQDKTADVYRWEPFEEYESQTFEQITIADVREHIDWLLS